MMTSSKFTRRRATTKKPSVCYPPPPPPHPPPGWFGYPWLWFECSITYPHPPGTPITRSWAGKIPYQVSSAMYHGILVTGSAVLYVTIKPETYPPGLSVDLLLHDPPTPDMNWYTAVESVPSTGDWCHTFTTWYPPSPPILTNQVCSYEP